MRLRLHLVYWVLLSTSIISSTLLFLLVASENAQGSKIIGPRKNYIFKLEDNSSDFQDVETPKVIAALKPEVVKNFQDIVGSFDGPSKSEESKIPNSIEILKESLTQQPNLSQGVSDGGQPIVVTLVDTASTLQNLADRATTNPDYPSPRSKSVVEGNASEIEKAGLPAQEPLLRVSTNVLDVTNLLPAGELIDNETTPEVLIVRAEQKKPDDVGKLEAEAESLEKDIPQMVESKVDRITPADAADGSKTGESAPVVAQAGEEPIKQQQEDIPSFNEWAQKRLEEAEKKKSHPNASIQTAGTSSGRSTNSMRVRSKNYASPDCGAKVVAANPESSSSRNILVSTRDEYMLNTCTSRVWFVVELCEAIQARKIEIANFELFSSSPKDFTVFVSDRYPTRDWLIAGQFTARDERDVQSFLFQSQLFGKYIKVEFLSHYGSEHFCPISLFRAYGTSEFEVLETETESEGHHHHHHIDSGIHKKDPAGQSKESESDEDDEEDAVSFVEDDDGKGGNIFGSARDAVLSIVRKAAQVLINTGSSKANNITKIQESIKGDVLKNSFETCVTPKYLVECHHCTDDRVARVFQIVSCRFRYLESLLESRFVYDALANTYLCGSFGFDRKIRTLDQRCEFPRSSTFLSLIFTPDYLIAMCNVLAAQEQRASTNVSMENTMNATTSEKVEDSTRNMDPMVSVLDQTKTETPMASSSEVQTAQIKPTKTVVGEEVKKSSSASNLKIESSKGETQDVSESRSVEALKTASLPSRQIEESVEATQQEQPVVPIASTSSKIATQTETSKVADKSDVSGDGGEAKIDKPKVEVDELKDAFENFDFKDLDVDSLQNTGANAGSVVLEPKASTPQQKESVFLRLSNRIKALERNMSLSSQYLEELSRRYKKQVEEMQRSLERALNSMSEESRKGEERESKRSEEIASLRGELRTLKKSLDDLLYERNSWHLRFSTLFQHAVFILVDVVLVMVLLSYCRRTGDLDYEDQEDDQSVVQMTRGKSYEIIKETVRRNKKPKHRRPSEIAAHISGPYNQLMIENGSRREKRKRRKKTSLVVRRSSSTKEYRIDLNHLRTIASDSLLVSRRASINGKLQPLDNSFLPNTSQSTEPTNGLSESSQSSSFIQFNSSQYSDKVELVSTEERNDLEVAPVRKSFRQKISSPSFMKTALGARIKRLSVSSNDENRVKLGSLSELETNGHIEESDESRSSSATPSKKKQNGLRKMVRKFFD